MKLSYRALCLASGAFLCDYLPENYEEWEEAELHSWLEDNAWEPLVHYEGAQIWDVIESHAITIQQLINEAGEAK